MKTGLATPPHHQLIAWFASNSVAANLLALMLVLGGLLTFSDIRQEVFQTFQPTQIAVDAIYPGSAPDEVEEAVCKNIEDAVRDLETIELYRSTAVEGKCTTTIDLIEGSPIRRNFNEIKTRIDSIDSFPEEVKDISIREVEVPHLVLSVAVYGRADEKNLKDLARRISNEIEDLPGVSQTGLAAVRPDELTIEITKNALLSYGLTLEQIAARIRSSSVDIPSGDLETDDRRILLSLDAKARTRQQFAELLLATAEDGSHIYLDDVAEISYGPSETDQIFTFNGDPVALIQVFRVGHQHDTEIAQRVRRFVERAQNEIPDNIELAIWHDISGELRDGLFILKKNGILGFALVVLVLSLFLRLRLAFWVAAGIPIAFCGTLWLMPMFDLSLNNGTLFAFLIVLGIVVDDAIVVAENIHRHSQMGKSGIQAAIEGCQEVAAPVMFSVTTSMATFLPLLFLPGVLGQVNRVIPMVVILTFTFSLVESFFILPAHLSHTRRLKSKNTEDPDAGKGVRSIEQLVNRHYINLIQRISSWRYSAIACAVTLLLLTVGILAGGVIPFSLLPSPESDHVIARVSFPPGTSVEATHRNLSLLEQSALRLREELIAEGHPEIIQNILVAAGSQPIRSAKSVHGTGIYIDYKGPYLGEVTLALSPVDKRKIRASEIVERWEDLTPPIPESKDLVFDADLISAGAPIHLELHAANPEELYSAAHAVEKSLTDHSQIYQITNSYQLGQERLQVELTSEGEQVGLTPSMLGKQIRRAFYGEEVQTLLQDSEEVKVMLRLPKEERDSIIDLESTRIHLPNGSTAPLHITGRLTGKHSQATIERLNGERTITITAKIKEPLSGRDFIEDFVSGPLHEIQNDYPGLRWSIGGEQKEQRRAEASLKRGSLLSLFMIYSLLAIPFRSYWQPLIILAAIPFGLIGAVWGHLLLGQQMTFMSLFGILAVSGVVINDSLVLLDFVRRKIDSGFSLEHAIESACTTRLRPIVLTSLTTFVGFLPLLMEKSLHAQFLIPIAVSMAFGVLFAAPLILLLVPSFLLIADDFGLKMRPSAEQHRT